MDENICTQICKEDGWRVKQSAVARALRETGDRQAHRLAGDEVASAASCYSRHRTVTGVANSAPEGQQIRIPHCQKGLARSAGAENPPAHRSCSRQVTQEEKRGHPLDMKTKVRYRRSMSS